jgi:UDP-N-acetylmuramoylalanine--D-glutamate ligase
LVKNYINQFAKSNKYAFPIPYEEFGKLIGEHNKLNVMASVLVARILKIDESAISKAIKEFSPLPHRLEYVGEYDNVKYYNDSIATIPEATISAIESLKEVDTVIAGGMNRGIDYYDFVKYLNKCSAKNIILMYETGELIFNKLNRSGVCLVKSLEEAVEKAKQVTEKGKICLLSPAAASYGHFKNFEERGAKFCSLVKGM